MPRRNAIIFLVDAKVFPPAVFQAYRLASLNRRNDTDICIVTDAKADIARAEAFGAPCRFYYMDPARVEIGMHAGYASRVSYYRAYFPALLAPDYARILHLDADIGIEDDRVFSLFDLDMGGHALAAVRDAMVAYSNVPANLAELRRALGSDSRKYLNNGVTLIDPDRFAALDLSRRTLAVIDKSPVPLPYANQSAINTALAGDWLELSPAFNMMVPLWKSFPRRAFPPSIVHFAGPAKPWHGRNFIEKHGVGAEMERFFASSPWSDFPANVAPPRAPPVRPGMKGPPPGPISLPSVEQRRGYDLKGLVRYLSETPFADVAAGLSRFHRDKLPSAVPLAGLPR